MTNKKRSALPVTTMTSLSSLPSTKKEIQINNKCGTTNGSHQIKRDILPMLLLMTTESIVVAALLLDDMMTELLIQRTSVVGPKKKLVDSPSEILRKQTLQYCTVLYCTKIGNRCLSTDRPTERKNWWSKLTRSIILLRIVSSYCYDSDIDSGHSRRQRQP